MSDYPALAQRVSLSIEGIRGCLMLSRDGMILGAHPEGEVESHLRAAWVRFVGVGDPERSYVEFPDQIWAFVRRGGYGAFAVSDVGVRPGVLVDLLEQALMAGEQDRVHDRESMRLPDAQSAPSGKPRTSLHKPERPSSVDHPEPVIVSPESPTHPASAEVGTTDGAQAPADGPTTTADDGSAAAGPAGGDGSVAPPAYAGDPRSASEAQEGNEDESEVDRILLAKEFAGLLQVPKEDDEASR